MSKWIKVCVPDNFDTDTQEVALVSQDRTDISIIPVWEPPYTNVLDHGFIGLQDFMGDDAAIVQAARVSYGKGTKQVQEDRGLLRYLMRHRHDTPTEMCLSGDTRIPLIYREGVTAKSYTMKELAEAFQIGGQANSWVKLVKIRTVNDDGTITETKIKRAWKTGTKKVYKVTEDSLLGRSITVTDNHPFYTPSGYKSLSELTVGDEVYINGINDTIIDMWGDNFTLDDISLTIGMSRSTTYRKLRSLGIDTSRRIGFERKDEVSDGRARARQACQITEGVRCVVSGDQAQEVHHLDENPHNNVLINLAPITRDIHKAFHNSNYFPNRVYVRKIAKIEELGEQDVYDLEVDHENHNFVAEGFVVHNCDFKFHVKAPLFVFRQWQRHRTASINEYSGRYSEMTDEMYMPALEDIQPQALDNKQGRNGELSDKDKQAVQIALEEGFDNAFETYQYLLKTETSAPGNIESHRLMLEEVALRAMAKVRDEHKDDVEFVASEDLINEKIAEVFEQNGFSYKSPEFPGLAKELARIVLPLAMYSEMYWKCNLRNIFNFIGLRSDPHAQKEIRVYSDAMLDLITPHVPWAVEAFMDYQFKGGRFSRMEMDVLSDIVRNYACLQHNGDISKIESLLSAAGSSKREIREFLTKIGV
jgi:thymidylate synthase (FAD)